MDERAFGRLVGDHRPGLQVFCQLMLGCPREADDVVRETVLRAWGGCECAEHRDSARSWLYRIALDACLDRLERRR